MTSIFAAVERIENRREFCRLDDLGILGRRRGGSGRVVWNARWGAGRHWRASTRPGQLDRVVKVAATNVTACCFGGGNMDTLYVTTARHGLTPAQLADERFAGGMFAVHTDVPYKRNKRFCLLTASAAQAFIELPAARDADPLRRKFSALPWKRSRAHVIREAAEPNRRLARPPL